MKLTKESLMKLIDEELKSLFLEEPTDKPEKKDDKESEGPKDGTTDIMDNPFDEKEKKEKKDKEKFGESTMKYKDLMKEMYGVTKSSIKPKKIKKQITQYTITENIKESSYYDNLTPMDKYNMNRYVGKKVNLYEGVIGFSKSDSIASGVEVPQKYIQKLNEGAKHGFDLTDFKNKGFEKVLKGLRIKPVADHKGTKGFFWKGSGITIITGNNPITGEFYDTGRRKAEKNYASYMGVEGKPELVEKAVELIKKYASYIKNEEPGKRGYI